MLERPTLPQYPRPQPAPVGRVRQFNHANLAGDLFPQGLPYPSASTPMPNLLIDEIMPSLSDSEWRLLCVVCRQTLGFVSKDDPKKRRGRDWLTHRQLKARTGRASAAVSHAIDSLVRKNLIMVQGVDGQPLLTPQERRRCQGMLFFSPTPRFLQADASSRADQISGSKGQVGEKSVDNWHDQ